MSEQSTFSPCIGVCKMGDEDMCLGCFRTSDEIERWMSCPDEEKHRIMERLPERMKAFFT